MLKLSDVARRIVVPDGIVSTGWPTVEARCRDDLGIVFDAWQQRAGRLVLARRAGGKLACMIGGAGLSVCRQAGKTYLVGGTVFGLALEMPGMLAIWSAHHGKTHAETFLSMQELAARPQVAPHIAAVYTGSGDEEVRFRNGSRILFGARERGFGRGVPGVDVIVGDEAQIMSERAVDAQLATMNTSSFGLAWWLGTPPRPEDDSEAWMRMRDAAWDGTLEDSVWIEVGAEPGSDPNDREVWKIANPSYPLRTPAESILRLQRKLTADSFRREGLGIYDPRVVKVAVAPALWKSLVDPGPEQGKAPDSLGVAAHDGQFSVVACWADDEVRHVEEVFASPRLDLVVDWLVGMAGHRIAVLVPNYGAAAPLQPMLRAKRVNAKSVTGGDVGKGCELLVEGCEAGWLTHADQVALADSVAGSRKKLGRDGAAWVFDLKTSTRNAPIMAVVLALVGAATVRPRRTGERMATVS